MTHRAVRDCRQRTERAEQEKLFRQDDRRSPILKPLDKELDAPSKLIKIFFIPERETHECREHGHERPGSNLPVVIDNSLQQDLARTEGTLACVVHAVSNLESGNNRRINETFSLAEDISFLLKSVERFPEVGNRSRCTEQSRCEQT